MTIAESSQEVIARIEQALRYGFELGHGVDPVRDPSVLRRFVRESWLVAQWRPVIAERIQKRFVTSFAQITKSMSAEKKQAAFLNTVGEYMLVSMGILDPKLFGLNSADLDAEMIAELKRDFRHKGLDVESLMKKYGLHEAGTIFWNRWAVRGERPSRESDQKILAFLTEKFREEGTAIFDAAEYDRIFARAKDIVTVRGNSVEARKEVDNELRELLIGVLTSERFEQTLLTIMSTKIFPALQKFFS